MRHLVMQLEEALAFVKGKADIAVAGGDKIPVDALIHGVWAIHKPVSGGGWKVTHVPTGLALASLKSQAVAKELVSAILEKMPDLYGAQSEQDVVKHKDLLLPMVRDFQLGRVTKAGQEASDKGGMTDGEIEQFMRENGFSVIGERYGKAGVQWGIPGQARRIGLGRRDLLLNYFLFEIESDGRQNSRWNMQDAELKSKIKKDKLAQWIEWVRKGPTTKQVINKAKEEMVSAKPDPYQVRRGVAYGFQDIR